MRSSWIGLRGCVLMLSALVASAPSPAKDCNSNGREDTADIGAGVSEDCNSNGVPDECEGLPVSLAIGSEENAVPSSAKDAAAGDLDGDGDLDLVVGHRAGSTSTLTVLLNAGDQTFSTAAEYEPPGRLYNVSLGDLNGDGFLDLAAANQEELVTLLGRGDGTFESAVSLPLGEADTRFTVLADLNGDGAADLVQTNRGTNTISVRMSLNGADGALAAPVAIDVDDSPDDAADPVAIAPGDFNGDGSVDLVTANNRSQTFSVLLNVGDGTFGPPAVHEHGARSVDALSLVVADLNGDDALDIATTSSQSLVVLLSTADGSFAAARSYDGTGIKFLEVADYDRDGDPDLVMRSTTPQGVVVRQNDGRGGFGVVTEVGISSSINALVAGDFNADGLSDLAAVVSDSVLFLWNGGSGGNAPSFSVEIDELPLVGCIEPRGCRPHGETLADIDGDGDLDAIGCVTHPGEFVIGENVGGVLVQRSDPWTFGTRNAAHGDHAQSVDSGDLDGDGDVDFVTVDNESHDFWVHINNGDATFENARFTRQGTDRRIRVGNQPIHVRLGDLDGDGDLDGISSDSGSGTISLLFNEGNGSFETTSRSIRVGSAPRATEIADLDGDGANDIAVAIASPTRSVGIFLNDGSGTFPPSGSNVRLVGSPYHVEAGDVDRDGDLDLVAAINDQGNCAVLLNEGDGTFAEPRSFGGGQGGAYSTSIADFDLDGLLDLITANEQGSSVSLLLGNGDGTFDPPIHYSVGSQKGLRLALPGDLDGDGDLDLVTNNRGSSDTTGHSFSVIYNQSLFDTPDYQEHLCTIGDFFGMSTSSGAGDSAQRFLKYTLPASAEAGIRSTLYQNTSRFPLHQDFLTGVFPERFPALDAATYNALVGLRDSRQYFVGALRMIWTADGPRFGFSVFAQFGDAKERLSVEEVKGIYDKLRETFRLEPLFYAPTSLEAVEVARQWQQQDPQPGFPILIEGATGAFEPYTIGVGYGRVRILSQEEFEQANDTGELSFQDVLVLSRAPRDIEGVVNGIITAERQGELSHVAVRTARRGTPNAFLRTALEDFAEFEGKLVRLEVTDSRYIVDEVTEREAEDFWAANAGFLSHLPSLDGDFAELADFEQIQAMDGRVPALEARFGGKASNLARLQTILTGPTWSRYQLKGFAIPMHYYLQFIRSNSINSFLDRERVITYEEYLLELFDHEEFSTSSRLRFDALENLRRHMRTFGKVDESLLQRLRDRIAAVHGAPPEVRVRFRSSSNVEDAIEFNGAGLYESTQACVADDLDGNDDGPSICDATNNEERDLTRALRRVWSSLWNFRAYEERAFYQIPDELPAMGVLCNEAFIGELANGVAFTGNPTNRHDRRYVVTVQKGDASVVSPEPGVLAEKNLLEMSGDGQVKSIIRAVASTADSVAPGEFVLSDDELRELGALMWHIDRNFPVEPGIYERDDIILDMEIKKRADGTLAVKQVRPFLLVERGPVPPTFTLEIPAGTTVCGVFNISRNILEEYEVKAQLHFAGGAIEMPTALESFSAGIVDRIVLGQTRDVATPLEPGKFTHEKVRGDGGLVTYRFGYEQKFALPGGEPVDLTLSLVDFETRDGVIVDESVILDEEFLTDQLALETRYEQGGRTISNFYASCDYRPLALWDIRVELEDGTSAILEERYRDEVFGDSQPAALVRATVDIAGERRVVTDYWDLVYKATRHNQNVEHLVILDPPVPVPGLEKPAYALQLVAPAPQDNIVPEGIYRDESLEEIARVPVASYGRAEILGDRFVRGDADGDGAVNLSDPVRILRYLFQGGPSGGCVKSLDANDNGSIEVTDGIVLLGHLFRGSAAPPAPFPDCGVDPTPDGLSCERLGCE